MKALELLQQRGWRTPTTTISELMIAGRFECFILEDLERGLGEAKVPGETAIPAGRYELDITWSPRFKRDLPLIFNVTLPDGRRLVRSADGKIQFEGVRMHTGNGPEDTEGCLITGRIRQPDNLRVLESTLAFAPLFAKLCAYKADFRKANASDPWAFLTIR